MTVEMDSTQLDLSQWIVPGNTITCSQGTGEPLTLTEILVDQYKKIGKLNFFLGTNYSKTIKPEHADFMSFTGIGAVGFNREFCKLGVLDVIPCHLSQIPTLLKLGLLKIDVIFIQVSQDAAGNLSLGAVNGYISSMIPYAKTVIAEVNEQTPWTYSSTHIDKSHIDVIIHSNRSMVQMKDQPINEIDQLVASQVIPYVTDGAILQIGIGSLPNAILKGLGQHKNLGIHSGVIGDNVLIDLIEKGVVNNSTKPFDKGISVTGLLFGSDILNKYAHLNPSIRVEGVEYTHDLNRIRQFKKFITINSAIEVDLTGQVNSESADTQYLGTIGGQTDFTRGAFASGEGRSIIVLPSMIEKSGKSRIVPQIGSGLTTSARADADIIATEFGVAELKGKTISQRVKSMIAIAHPSHQEMLEKEARTRVAGYH